jgi:eukaryotic-like serine/threonine-protein kinase
VVGKYRVDRVLGEGGMGVVVAATHAELDQQVALKFLLPTAAENPEVVERFLREARAAVKIHSEHVARVFDVGKHEGVTPFMVMEYLEGQDLAGVLVDRGPLPVQEAVGYVRPWRRRTRSASFTATSSPPTFFSPGVRAASPP